jgi:hypothetical protein
MIQLIRCRDCAFWESATPENALSPGFCRRYAPRPIQGDDLPEWAATRHNDWCGEAQPARIFPARQISEDDRDDAKQAIEYVKAYPALFINEKAQDVVIKMLMNRFQL